MISTSEEHAQHLFPGLNTQQLSHNLNEIDPYLQMTMNLVLNGVNALTGKRTLDN